MLSNGANAIQLHTNVDGAPIDQEQFLPIYEIIERSGKPILLHPIRTREMADYRTETVSKYEICSVIGWPFETGAALARLVFSGIMDRFPNLKVITHHLGGIIPYFEGRVAHSWDQLGARTSDEDYSLLLKKLKKRPFDYFKDFYGDTALAGARAPTICGLSFFGADHVLFASDCPFDKEKGRGYIRSTIAVMELLGLARGRHEKDLPWQRRNDVWAAEGLIDAAPPAGAPRGARVPRARCGNQIRDQALNAPVGAVSLVRTAEERCSRAGVRRRCSLRCWRWPPRMRIRSRTSTSEGRSISLSAPGRAAATTSMRGCLRATSASSFPAIRLSSCRTCQAAAACAPSISSTTSPRRMAPRSARLPATCRSSGSSAAMQTSNSIRAS